MATTSLNLLHLPFSKSPLSFSSSRQLPSKYQKSNGDSLLLCKGKRGGFNIEVVLEDDEPAELALSLFQRESSRAGIPGEWRRRMHYESEKQERIRKGEDLARSRSRQRNARRGGRSGGGKGQDSESDDEEEDSTGALAMLMDPEYEEGNLQVFDQDDIPEDLYDTDGSGDFPISIF